MYFYVKQTPSLTRVQ